MKVNGQWVPNCVRNSSYSFMPIHLKLYMCLQFELSHFFFFFGGGHFSDWIEGTLCAQLLLQFNTDTFET